MSKRIEQIAKTLEEMKLLFDASNQWEISIVDNPDTITECSHCGSSSKTKMVRLAPKGIWKVGPPDTLYLQQDQYEPKKCNIVIMTIDGSIFPWIPPNQCEADCENINLHDAIVYLLTYAAQQNIKDCLKRLEYKAKDDWT